MVNLDFRDARPIYAQIIDNFRGQIAAGILQNGDKLPSVRDLASQLAINPNTIQRSYHQLEAEGWIATVPGKGHALRHTYAIRAIESGMQPKVLQKLLGHASIKTTMDRYVHVTDTSMTNAVKQFERSTNIAS